MSEPTAPIQMVELEAGFNGTAYAEGMRPSAVAELWDNMSEYEKIKTERMRLNKRESELKAEHPRLYRKYQDYFLKDDQNPNIFRYEIGGLSMDVEVKEDLVIKTHPTPDAAPISAAAQNVGEIAPLKKGRKKMEDSPADIY